MYLELFEQTVYFFDLRVFPRSRPGFCVSILHDSGLNLGLDFCLDLPRFRVQGEDRVV